MQRTYIPVVELHVLELLLADRLHALLVVERVPQLACDEQIFALYKPLLDGACDTLASLLLVTVVFDKSVYRYICRGQFTYRTQSQIVGTRF